MFYKAKRNTVFRRYNITVVVAFIAIIVIALSVASIQYYNELSHHQNNELISLKQEAEKLNDILAQCVNAISSIQKYAQYILEHPTELNIASPAMKQSGELFYLDESHRDFLHRGKRLSSSITGLGKIKEFSALKKQEIAMANALTPAFMLAQNVIEEATWFYYVSYQNFVSLYPWVNKNIWQFNVEMVSNQHNTALKELTKKTNTVIWSDPYIDSAASGMKASIGKGVFYQNDLLGSVVLDINLARLQRSLPALHKANQGIVLYNKNNQILIFKRRGKEPLNYRASWQELLPDSLRYLNASNLELLDSSAQLGQWFIEKQALEVNGWTLLKYQRYNDFTAPLRSRFLFVFSVLFIGLFAFLMFVNAMTKRTFIKPTTAFIRHIEYCAQGDPGKVKPIADWLHWFQVVEDIFTQNRSLLLQLREQNDVLDTRVNEKTVALQKSSKKHHRDYVLLRSVMNAIPELIVFNDSNGLLAGCNQSFERLTNKQERTMLGAKSTNFMPEHLAKEIDYLNSINNEIYPQKALIKAGNFIYQGFCTQFENEQGDFLGTITILRDVTKQQAIQSALEKAKNQAEYANQAKIQFLANMSHEIRTPINAIQGMLDLLLNTPLTVRQQHYLTTAKGALVTLLHLVNELLDLSKVEAGKMTISKENIHLLEVIDKALKLNVADIDLEKVKLLVEVSPKVPSVVISDEMRLVQVLTNLLNNAIKFTENGHVKLLVDAISVNQTIAQTRFSVIDTGIGIAQNNQTNLFEAFTQADQSMTRQYGGSGLGLSICQQIIKLLGGEISLKSTLGQGSEFSFTLPLDIAKATTAVDYNICKERKFSLCVINQDIPQSLIEIFYSLGWEVSSFKSLDDFYQNTIQASIVLLIDEQVFIQSKYTNKRLLNDFNVVLLGFCHPPMAELKQKTSNFLEQLNTTYVILDKPLYRFSMEKILVSLPKDNSLVNTLIPKENSSRNAPQRLSNKIPCASNKTVLTSDAASITNDDLLDVRVLLVEDNKVNQLVAKELLLSMNAQVTIADNGQHALTILEDTLFDIILMDIQMPIMDGLTTTKKIRQQERFSSLPIIAMTAHARTEDKEHSLAVGMNLHIAKPVTKDILFTSITKVLTNPRPA